MSHRERGTGRTTKMLQEAIEAVSRGERVAVVMRDGRQRDYAKGIIASFGGKPDSIRWFISDSYEVRRARGVRLQRFFVDHAVSRSREYFELALELQEARERGEV